MTTVPRQAPSPTKYRNVAAHLALMLACAVPRVAPAAPPVPPAPGSTLEQVRAAVAHYLELHPNLRPNDAWLTYQPAPTCSKPRYPLAGLREELMGTSVLHFTVGADGKAENVRLQRSAGWAVLDEAAFESLATCTLVPNTTDTQTVAYRFYLD